MDGKYIRSVLEKNGCRNLYHTNTVRTSLTYLEQGGLLSRGKVEARNLIQTYQKSDNLDKQYGLWNDIFFDSVDIHNRISNINFYGPVMFVLKLDVLNDYHEDIFVTKSNPVHWTIDSPENEKFYLNNNDFEQCYRLGDFRSMFIAKNINMINFDRYLEKIIIDVSGLICNGTDVSNYSMSQLLSTASIYFPKIKNLIFYRMCAPQCNCKITYAKMYRKKVMHFFNI